MKRWFIDMKDWKSFNCVCRCDRFSNEDILHTRDSDQITRFSFLNFTAFQTKETKEFGNTEVLSRSIQFRKGYLVPNFYSTTEDTSDTNTSNEVVVIKQGYLELKWLI